MDTEPEIVPFLTGFTYTKRRYTPEINTEAEESIDRDLISKFGLLDVEQNKPTIAVDEFRCGIKGCKSAFTDVQAYEAHYNSAHKNVCQFCKKNYPTPFWLEIHILEHHDNYFKLLATKQNMYQCLVESCKERFINEEKRKQHLIHIHLYPKSFDFQNLTARSIKRKPKKSIKDSAKNSPATENKTKAKKTRNPFNKMDIDDISVDDNNQDNNTDIKADLMSTEQIDAIKIETNSIDSPNIVNNDNTNTSNKTNKTNYTKANRGNKGKNNRGRGRSKTNNSDPNTSSNDIKNDNEGNGMQVEANSQQIQFKGSVPKSFNFGRGRGRGMQRKAPQIERDYFQKTVNTISNINNDVSSDTSENIEMKN